MRKNIHKAVTTVATTRHGLALEILILFALPLFLVKILPAIIHIRHLVLLFSLIYIYVLGRTGGLTARRMGLTLDRFLPACRRLVVPTFILMASTTIFGVYQQSAFVIPAFTAQIRLVPLWAAVTGYVLFSVPLQELIFRAFYLPRLELLTSNRTFLITVSALLFMIAHLPFQNLFLVIATGILGVVWADSFIRYRSLPAIMLSHALIGSVMWLTIYRIF